MGKEVKAERTGWFRYTGGKSVTTTTETIKKDVLGKIFETFAVFRGDKGIHPALDTYEILLHVDIWELFITKYYV